MNQNSVIRLVPLLLCAFLFAGCRQESSPPPEAEQKKIIQTDAVTEEEQTPVDLQDVIETTTDYIVGISYPKALAKYPALARVVYDYAQSVRQDLRGALAALEGEKEALIAPYDLSLQFATVAETSRIVAVSAEGSLYTGGAHGMPLVERFVWLPQMEQMLTADMLITEPTHWQVVAAYVREQLMTGLSTRFDDEMGDEASPADRAAWLKNGAEMIDSGTSPEAESFSRFEPVMNADGSIRALRFIFPPYQVGPYADGTHAVEVPGSVLAPLVAASYKPLFRAE